MGLSDNVTVTRNNVYKGACQVALSNDSYTSFPGELESVINPTTYELDAAYTPLGGTSEDGVVLRRSAELSDGIPIDQRRTALDEGEPESWTMESEVTMMETHLDNLKTAWEGGDIVDISGSLVNQRMMPLGAPASFKERVYVIIQEDVKTGRLRVAALRKTTVMVDGSELNMQKTNATGLAMKLKVRADENVAEHHGPFGKMFEETLS
jgi:hypothetical protein